MDETVAGLMLINPNLWAFSARTSRRSGYRPQEGRAPLLRRGQRQRHHRVSPARAMQVQNVLHFNPAKTFSTPHVAAAGSGPVAVKKELAGFPARTVVEFDGKGA